MVELNVALENVCAQAQHALKSIHRKLRDTPFNIQNEFPKGKLLRTHLALSSLTHLSGPLAMTVAARGRSNSRAISPGQRKRKRRVN